MWKKKRSEKEHKAVLTILSALFPFLHFPIKNSESRPEIDESATVEREKKKCEFDMILIFKLHILLLFIFTSTMRVEGHTMRQQEGPEGTARECSFNI